MLFVSLSLSPAPASLSLRLAGLRDALAFVKMLDTQRIRTFLLSLTVVEHALAGWIDTASLREQNILQRRRNPLRPRASNSPILFRQSLSSDATYTICPPRTGHYIVLAGVNYMDGSNTLICNYDDGAQCLYNPAVPGDNSGGSSNVPEQGPPCPSSSSCVPRSSPRFL